MSILICLSKYLIIVRQLLFFFRLSYINGKKKILHKPIFHLIYEKKFLPTQLLGTTYTIIRQVRVVINIHINGILEYLE